MVASSSMHINSLVILCNLTLSVTITTGTDTCPSELQTCTTGDDPTCCPSGTFCEDNGDYCCPIGVDCSSVVKLAPVCADSSWSLYEADGNGKDFFCCLPGAHGLPGSGCVQDGAAAETVTASSIIQATAAPKASSTATSETGTTTTQGETTATGTSAATSGSGNGTSTAQPSSTSTKSGANKIFSGTSTAILAAIFVFGFAAS